MPPHLPNRPPTSGRGLLIAFEGIDACGKTTQIRALENWLGACGVSSRTLSPFKSGGISEQLSALNSRSLIDARDAMLMYAADFASKNYHVVQPLLQQGDAVIWDKYVMGVRARDRSRDFPDELLDALYGSMPVPDVVFYISLPPEIAVARTRDRGGPSMWESGLDYFLKLRIVDIQERIARGVLSPEELNRYFVAFQERVSRAYEEMLPHWAHIHLDGRLGVDQLSEFIRTELSRH